MLKKKEIEEKVVVKTIKTNDAGNEEEEDCIRILNTA
jgi:hypothetical protein